VRPSLHEPCAGGATLHGMATPKAALLFCWSMIFPENRCPARIKSGPGFFGIML